MVFQINLGHPVGLPNSPLAESRISISLSSLCYSLNVRIEEARIEGNGDSPLEVDVIAKILYFRSVSDAKMGATFF